MLARATPTFKHCIIFSILFSLEFHIKKLLNTHLNAEGHDACVIFPWLWVSSTPHWA